MNKTRLEAFSDGVLAIIITIMVLDVKPPAGTSFSDLLEIYPTILSYALSFIYVGIYWNNHHHMFQAVHKISGGVLWTNLHLLFWLSLVPVATAWVGKHPTESLPAGIYGFTLFCPGIAYTFLTKALLKTHGKDSDFARALGSDIKGKLSISLYAAGIVASFYQYWLGYLAYLTVALMWLIPDRRFERREESHVDERY